MFPARRAQHVAASAKVGDLGGDALRPGRIEPLLGSAQWAVRRLGVAVGAVKSKSRLQEARERFSPVGVAEGKLRNSLGGPVDRAEAVDDRLGGRDLKRGEHDEAAGNRVGALAGGVEDELRIRLALGQQLSDG